MEEGKGDAMRQRAPRVVGDYLIGPRIGSGSFAVVWRARHRLHGHEVAVKEIDKKRLNVKVEELLLKEITILRNICHPNIIRLHEALQSEDSIFLVLEYCAGGDLAAYIQRHGCQGRVSDGVTRHFMRQLANGLKVLRENNLIHRDLKPQNLLLSTDGETPMLKIGDFGFARYLMPQGLADTLCGSPLYMAPEIFQERRYDAKADLWSVGAILFQLVTGKLPFGGNTHFQLFQNIMSTDELQFPQDLLVHIHPDCISLCRSLLRRNPVERLTFEEFFNHNFMTLPSGSGTSVESENTPDVNLEKDNQQSFFNASRTGVENVDQGLLCTNSLNVADSLENIEREYVFVHSNFASIRVLSTSSEASLLDNSNTRSVSYTQENFDKGNPGVVQSTSTTVSPACGEGQSRFSSHSCASQASVPLEDVARESQLHSTSQASTTLHYISRTSQLHSPLQASTTLDDIARASQLHSTSQASNTLDDIARASSLHPSARFQLLNHYIKALTNVAHEKLLILYRYEVLNKMVFRSSNERGLLLESFSLELVVLAVWKEAIKVCEAWISHDDGDTLARLLGDQSDKSGNLYLKTTDKLDYTRPSSVCSWAEKEFIFACDRAEEICGRLKGIDGDTEMPDAMEILFQTALVAGKSGAADELLGHWSRAAASYSKAITFLSFIVFEATSLGLNPSFSLSSANQQRLRTYIAALKARLKVLNGRSNQLFPARQ